MHFYNRNLCAIAESAALQANELTSPYDANFVDFKPSLFKCYTNREKMGKGIDLILTHKTSASATFSLEWVDCKGRGVERGSKQGKQKKS